MAVVALICIPVTEVSSATSVSTGGARIAARSVFCPQVEVLGAAGSGERDGKQIGSFDGVGEEVDVMFKEISKDLKIRGFATPQLWADPYRADSVNVLLPSTAELISIGTVVDAPIGLLSWDIGSLGVYKDSVKEGAALFVEHVRFVTSACPSTQLIAIGYSQGAMAIHEGEVALARSSPRTLRRIDASVLLGDGYRVAHSRAVRFGTAPESGEGVATWAYLSVTHQKSLVRDVGRPSAVAEVCDNSDIVCDFSAGTFSRPFASEKVHTHYLLRDRMTLVKAADWAAKRVTTTTTTSTTTPVVTSTTIATGALQRFTAFQTSGPQGFFTTLRSPSPCPSPTSGQTMYTVAQANAADWQMNGPNWSATGNETWLGFSNTPPGTYQVNVSCEQGPASATNPTQLQIVENYPPLTITVTSGWVVASVTPATASTGESLSLSAIFPAQYGAGIARACLTGQTNLPQGGGCGPSATFGSSGTVTVNFTLPAGLNAGTYALTLNAAYSPDANIPSYGVLGSYDWGISTLVTVNVTN